MIGFLVFSRIVIGLGANPTIGKNYILNYSSKYFLPYISKIYVFISILGHSIGPLIGFALYEIPDIKLITFVYYSKFNCIGWYGLIMSIILFIMHILLFTSPNSKKFSRLDLRRSQILYLNSKLQINTEATFLDNDMEDTQDKEFYQLQKEKFSENNEDNMSIDNNNSLIEIKEKYKDKENDNYQRTLSRDDDKIIESEEKDDLIEIDIPKNYKTQIGGLKKTMADSNNKNNIFLERNLIKKKRIRKYPNKSFINFNRIFRRKKYGN